MPSIPEKTCFDDWLALGRQRIEDHLQEIVPHADKNSNDLLAAMNYATINGGKRMRSLLCLAVAEELVSNASHVTLDAACAVELVHCYSLVHDDLPCMDDDTLRRGKPSTHAAFGEATALLAGDALLTLAFHVIAKNRDSAPMICTLATAAGHKGMAGGQALDLALESLQNPVKEHELISMHLLKTGALIRASLELGALSINADDHILPTLQKFGDALGLLYQIVDDIIDETGTKEEIGKTPGKDKSRMKTTFTTCFGLEESRRKASEVRQQAIAELDNAPFRTDLLRNITQMIYDRIH